MGVTGLWSVLQPCARPVKLETLNRKRLAIDASIWIYQFLKAVRDKEGHALRNAHVVGFFRRVCKLLFVGVKPVFVFDGGAPALKRETVQRRKRRREGRREDAIRTAGKLLGVQMRRRAELEREEERGRKRRPEEDEAEEDGIKEGEEDKLVYVDELQMTPQERARTRQFKKTDAYHLPALDPDGFQAMGAPNDPRIMSQVELEEYARQFHSGEDVNVYDFSAIDFDGTFFRSLPAGDRYNILNAARLRSRLRMGYSKEQLDGMFPDRMAFSRFQIERVKERNELTQRLMGINGINGEDDGQFGNRVAGEKGKEYVLVKNDGVEGGWALGVVSNKAAGGERSQPIDVDGPGITVATADMEGMDDDLEDEDEGFEDVPIEGLNRLPKRPAPGAFIPGDGLEPEEVVQRRKALYEARQRAVHPTNHPPDRAADADDDDTDALFVPQAPNIVHADANLNEETMERLFEDGSQDYSDDDLNRAIAMSLEQDERANCIPPNATVTDDPTATYKGPRPDQRLEYNQKNAQIGRNVAHLWNARAREMAAPPSRPFLDDSDEEDDAQAKSRSMDYRAVTDVDTSDKKTQPEPTASKSSEKQFDETTPKGGQMIAPLPSLGQDPISGRMPKFDGPLPFESLNLGTSKLRKKKADTKVDEAEAGGFEKAGVEEAQKSPQPIPPWFSGEVRDTTSLTKAFQVPHDEDKELDNEVRQSFPARLRKQQTGEVIDLDLPKNIADDVIEVESSGDEGQHDFARRDHLTVEVETKMGDAAEEKRGKPSNSKIPSVDHKPDSQPMSGEEPYPQHDSDSEVFIEWDDSDLENENRNTEAQTADVPKGRSSTPLSSTLPPELDNVVTTESTSPSPVSVSHDMKPPPLPDRQSIDDSALDAFPGDDEDQYSDPEDAELMRQLAIEADEHARFASTLNSKSQAQNAEDYEQELRQLRNQQKKDRRDADEVSQIMITECQQLLRLFGIPYITAPMEAEAQCAELVSLGLVDGIVTDDSDIFLFGGTRVYKNMFNQAKFVECYLSSDLEKEYSLDRHKLIGVAHLLGSDYTEGIPSVGPVTALEILSEFGNLKAFAEWWSQVQLGQKLSAEDAANPFRRKFKRTASKLFLPTTFPDQRVDQAYLHPEVDRDPSAFAWGVPDLDALRQYLMATIGWSPERTDEVLVPVIKDMNRREDEGTQANITRFFGGGVGTGAKASSGSTESAFAPRRRGAEKSKRMEKALGRLHATATATATKRIRAEGDGDDDEPGVHGGTDDVINGSSMATVTAAGQEKTATSQRSSTQANNKGRGKRAAPKNGSGSDSDDGAAATSEEALATKARRRKRGKRGTR